MNLDLLARLAEERRQQEPVLQARLQALEQCLQNLNVADRELIAKRYQSGLAIEELVLVLKTSRRTLFRNLDRIRRLLYECINRRIAGTDAV